MTVGPIAEGGPPVVPRPGVVKTLGVLNILFATVLGTCVLASSFWSMAMIVNGKSITIEAAAGKSSAGALAVFGNPALVRFWIIDLATGLPLNVLMFATGIGLVNLRRWGATWWVRGAWAKIVRLIAVYSYFLVGVVPALSAGMGRLAMAMIEAQKLPQARGPTVTQMTLIYTYMYSALGAAMILLGVIYPALSIWLLGRPGSRAALAPPSSPTSPDPAVEPSPP